MPTVYPIVPGHEIVGRVTQVGVLGHQVQARRPRRGRLLWSTRTAPAPQCKAGFEQFCPNMTLTFNSPDKHLGGVTYGGYSGNIVVDERFVLRVPANLNLAGAAPLLCAGITTYSPMAPLGRHQGQESRRGRPRWTGPHGCEVRPCIRSPASLSSRPRPARRRTHIASGADEVVVSRNAKRDARSSAGSSTSSSTPSPPITTSMLTSTCSAPTAPSPSSEAPEKPLQWAAFSLPDGPRRNLSGSLIRRHRPDAGDAGLLRRTQHHRRRGSHPDPEGQRKPTSAGPVRCEVPLLDRHGFSEI